MCARPGLARIGLRGMPVLRVGLARATLQASKAAAGGVQGCAFGRRLSFGCTGG